jgi:hypothetical protein
MSTDPQNPQYSNPGPIFGDASGYADSNAPGSPGVQDQAAGVGGGPVIATPVVSIPGASSQLAENMPHLPVTTGDTAGMTSDAPVPPGGDPLTGLGLDSIANTGAGSGTVITPHHPNAGSRD